ncbi:ABC transporter permease [Fimbriimonas ginsengisoli]|uniref:ABC transporter permease n=1 Tax=Fimbriimonas ginsengisoli TaxID=1005039 RepID=UPI000695C640|nr:ABC transporter permease [Fimbriimonas ginsengisoli]
MSTVKRLIFFSALILLWGILASRHIWDSTLFPSPIQVAKSLGGLISDGSLLNATAVSLRRVLVGYGISLAIGVPLGILLGRQDWAEQTLGSLVSGFQSLPSICWLPLALLWFGLNDRAILFVIVMGSLVSISVAVRDGVRNLPPTYVRAARTLGTSPLRMYTDVLLPASLPAVLTGAKLGWSYAWRALMSGELLFVSLGLGHLLMMGRELADMSQVLSVMIVIIALGLLTDTVIFGSLERYVRRSRGLGTA